MPPSPWHRRRSADPLTLTPSEPDLGKFTEIQLLGNILHINSKDSILKTVMLRAKRAEKSLAFLHQNTYDSKETDLYSNLILGALRGCQGHSLTGSGLWFDLTILGTRNV